MSWRRVSTVDTSPVDDPSCAPPREERLTPRQAERAFYAELVSQLQQMYAAFTQTMTRLVGRSVNNVLEVGTKVIPATGDPVIALSYRVPLGAITVRAGAHPVTIAWGGVSSTATVPTQGTGIWIVPANTRDTVALTGHAVTLYATAGDSVSYQVFAAGPTPSS